jgi:hypothetical protein
LRYEDGPDHAPPEISGAASVLAFNHQRKKTPIILAIERDGRLREFRQLQDAADHYRISGEDIENAIQNKTKIGNIWFRRRLGGSIPQGKRLGFGS